MSGVTVPSAHQLRRRSFSFRVSRLRWPEWLAAISAVVLLVSLVALSWFTFLPASGGAGAKYYVSTSEDGWHGLGGGHWLVLITVLVALGLFMFQAGRRSPGVGVTMSVFLVYLGALTVIWLIVRVVIDPPGGRNFGGWLALLSAIALTWGAFESLRTEGIAPEDGPGEIPVITAEDMARERASAPDTDS